jgi:hypothetical protein
MKMRFTEVGAAFLLIVLKSAVAGGSISYSQQIIPSTSNIFGAGLTTAPDPAGTAVISDADYGGGVLPPGFKLPPNPGTLSFSSVSGKISPDRYGSDTLNDADGAGSIYSQFTVAGFGSISGIEAPKEGWLVGVFETDSGPTGATPVMLNFLSSSLTTSFTAISPQLDQTFFIGDGLTSDGSGQTQQFEVPLGATRLYLGLADSDASGDGPGHYDDNAGYFQASFSITSVPEPASMCIICISTLALVRPRRAGRKNTLLE